MNAFVRHVTMKQFIPADYVIIAQMKATTGFVRVVVECALIITDIQIGVQLQVTRDTLVNVKAVVQIAIAVGTSVVSVEEIFRPMQFVQAVIGVIIVISIVDILHVRTAVNAVVAANVDNNILIIK